MTALEQLILQSKELSSLPEIYTRVSELLDDEDSCSEKIGAVVQSDPAITSKILKVVNSPFYGFPSEISTIAQAINILGRNPLRQLLISSVIGGVFSRFSNEYFSMDEFWQHSVHTSVIAKYCYQNIVGKMKSDELFIAGLLHDIGKLIIAHQIPESTLELQRLIDLNEEHILDIETQQFGFTHAEVAASIMDKWGLPSLLQSCALHHHSPEQAEEQYQVQAWVIHIANALSNSGLKPEEINISKQLAVLDNWQKSTLTEEQIMDAYQQAYEQYQLVLDSLGL